MLNYGILIKNCNIEEAKQMPNDMDKLTDNVRFHLTVHFN